MINYINSLIAKYSPNGIIIDTNIMLVYIVGTYDIEYIADFKRTAKYCADDYKFICHVLPYFNKKVITTHILTELSNLSMQIQDNRLAGYFSAFRELLKEARENYINKDRILGLPLLPKLGVTDLAILEVVKKFKYLTFTDDFRMSGYIRSMGIDVLNLNDIRTVEWLKLK